jgi:hypothetical protein
MQVFDDRFQAESGCGHQKPHFILTLLGRRSSKTSMKITSAECTVENS